MIIANICKECGRPFILGRGENALYCCKRCVKNHAKRIVRDWQRWLHDETFCAKLVEWEEKN